MTPLLLFWRREQDSNLRAKWLTRQQCGAFGLSANSAFLIDGNFCYVNKVCQPAPTRGNFRGPAIHASLVLVGGFGPPATRVSDEASTAELHQYISKPNLHRARIAFAPARLTSQLLLGGVWSSIYPIFLIFQFHWSQALFGPSLGWLILRLLLVPPLYTVAIRTSFFVSRQQWSWWWDLNPQPFYYKSNALPLRHTSMLGRVLLWQYP